MADYVLDKSMNMRQAFDAFTAAYAGREALVYGSTRDTYAELAKQVYRTASALHGLGLQKGDRVAVILPNCAEYVYLFWGIAVAGGVFVPVNPFFRQQEIRHVLFDSDATIAILIPNAWGNDLLGIVQQARPDLPLLRHVVVRDDPAPEGTLSLTGLIASAEPNPPSVDIAPDDLVGLVYTSGTTGLPKAAMLTHGRMLEPRINYNKQQFETHKQPIVKQLVSLARLTARYGTRFIKYGTKQQKALGLAPLYTTAGYAAMREMLIGGYCYMTTERFQPVQALELIEREKVNVMVGTPTMYKLMLQVPEFDRYDKSSLLMCTMGAAWCPPSLAREVRQRFNAPYMMGFGLTELGGGVSMSTLLDPPDLIAETVGRVGITNEVKIVDENRREVPHGQVGEIAARMPGMMTGYWKAPELTAETLDADGFLYTGDLGVIDDKGFLRIVGRKKDMIVRGGQNVYPAEIERHLLDHPAVEFAAVIGVPSELEGETVWAYVVPRSGMTLTSSDVLAHCAGKIAPFKVPSEVRVVESLPMTENLKVQKFKLRETALAELEQRKRPA